MKLKNITMSALFCALTCVATAFVKIPLTVTGYVHLGDAFIFLACAFLPMPYAVAAAGLGGAAADILAGYFAYAPITLLAKCCMASVFSVCFSKNKRWLAVLGAVLATVTMTAWYFVFEWCVYGLAISAANVPFNLLQGGACAIAALPCAYSLKKFWYRKENCEEQFTYGYNRRALRKRKSK